MPKEKRSIKLNIIKLQLLQGRYDTGYTILPVILEDGKIFMQLPEQNKYEIFSEDDTHFFFDQLDGTIEFIKEKDKVSGLILNLGGPHKGVKIE